VIELPCRFSATLHLMTPAKFEFPAQKPEIGGGEPATYILLTTVSNSRASIGSRHLYWAVRSRSMVFPNTIQIAPGKTRRRSKSAYIRQVNFLQILCRVGEGDAAPLKLNLYLKPFSKYRNNGHERYWDHDLTFHGHLTSSMTSSFDPPYAISY